LSFYVTFLPEVAMNSESRGRFGRQTRCGRSLDDRSLRAPAFAAIALLLLGSLAGAAGAAGATGALATINENLVPVQAPKTPEQSTQTVMKVDGGDAGENTRMVLRRRL
jgi:hypothetical protein